MTADQETNDKNFKEHCQQSWRFTQKIHSKNPFSIRRKPWILMLGTDQAGKTTLLKQSSLNLNTFDNKAKADVQTTQLFDFWANKNVVFIDPSSSIENIEELYDFIKKHRTKPVINHIIITIDLATLQNATPNCWDSIRSQIESACKLSDSLSVSIVISKCDDISGFQIAFDDLNEKQRQQILGVTFSESEQKENLSASVKNELSALLNRINQRLIHRLHREQSQKKRRRIFQLPVELSKLFEPLDQLIKQLPFDEELHLKGIYFTGYHYHRSFFISKLMKLIVEKAREKPPVATRFASERLIALPIMAAIVFAMTLLWHFGYNAAIRTINSTIDALGRPQLNTNKNLTWIDPILTLQKVNNTIGDNGHIPYQLIGLPQIRDIKKTASQQQSALLNEEFIPYLKETLTNEIQLGLKGNKLALYDALKAYLSISNEKYYKKSIILNWFQTYWEALFHKNPSLQNQLLQYLSNLLDTEKQFWVSDSNLVTQAQTALKKLPLSDLAFLELQGQYDANNVTILSKGQIEGISLKNAAIPEFFSTENFKTIYNQVIPNIGQILDKGSWVLGTTTGTKISEEQQTKIAAAVRKMYLDYYTSVWASSIANISLTQSQDIPSILNQIDEITNKNSQLQSLLKVVIGNASLGKGATTKGLTAIKNFLNQQGNYKKITDALNRIKAQLQSINNSKTPNKTSFQITSARFEKNVIGDPISELIAEANNNPEPIHSWLNAIALNSWKISLVNTRSYLNRIWSTIVLPVYHHDIKGRYPVFKDSSDNISMKNFNGFFGPKGAIGAFFIYYLQPFVNMSSNYWTWRSLNGMDLGISQAALNTFIRASIIQQMFFTNNQNKAGFKFILAAISLSGNAKSFTMNIGGQTVVLSQQKKNIVKQINWPGTTPNIASLRFTTTSGENKNEGYTGPWAWFRLLDANTFRTTSDPEQFTLTVHIDNYVANFKLVAEHRVNPMVPGIIGKYRCPDKL